MPVEIVDYNLVYGTVLQLINQPALVNVFTVNDDLYEGTETINLTLSQGFSSNNVTNDSGLISDSVLIIVEDNDSKLYISGMA